MSEPTALEQKLRQFLEIDLADLEEMVGISVPGSKSYRQYEGNIYRARFHIGWTGNLVSLKSKCDDGPLKFTFPVDAIVAQCIEDCSASEFLEKHNLVLLEVKRKDIASTLPGIYALHMSVMGKTMYDGPDSEARNLVHPLVYSNGVACSDTFVNGVSKESDLDYFAMSKYVKDGKHQRYHRIQHGDVFGSVDVAYSNPNVMVVPRKHPVLLHIIRNLGMFMRFQEQENILPALRFEIGESCKTKQSEAVAYRMPKVLFDHAAKDFASKTLKNHKVIDKRQSVIFTITSMSSREGSFSNVIDEFGLVEHEDPEVAHHFSSDAQAAIGSFSCSIEILFHAEPLGRK